MLSNSMQLVPFTDRDAALWDELVAASPSATFLHTRRYLSYHGDKFKDASALVYDEKGALVGLFPAAVDPSAPRRVVSHPGVTYGGIIHQGKLGGERMLKAFRALQAFYSGRGFETLRYKAVPYIYCQSPAGDDLYALFRFGATRYRCDLSCAVELSNRRAASARRKRGLKKALTSGVRISEGVEFAAPLWNVLEENLVRKYGARPVHTLAEITYLHSLFPHEIKFVVAQLDGEVTAGVVLFVTPRVVRAQYIAASVAGYKASALDAVFEHCLETARTREGVIYFDFGTSNEDEGRCLNADLYQFKAEFGGGGVAQEFYELDLREPKIV